MPVRTTSRTHQPRAFTLQWRCFLAAVVFTAVAPLMFYSRVSYQYPVYPRTTARTQQRMVLSNLDGPEAFFHRIEEAAKGAESRVLEFFHGEPKALEDGVPYGQNATLLTRRLAGRIAHCRTHPNEASCVLKVVFLGSAQASGRDNFYNESFPFFAEHRLREVAKTAGLELLVYNHAMDSDLSREGPQSNHMCVQNLVGDQVDVISWDLDGTVQANPPAQVEAFVRWASLSQPAMILINKGGPHGRSRRGEKKTIVNLGPGHDAMVYDDNENQIPEARQEAYRESVSFGEKWQHGRNQFWEALFEKYAGVVDFAAIDPEGSIWHLDHLQEFSNAAFDADKVLPLVDCGVAHPPPCDQIPDFVENKLIRAGLTVESIPKEDIGLGAVCSAMVGCRHLWYGGKRSHTLRGELNALPIVRAVRDAARELQQGTYSKAKNAQRSLATMNSLPSPEFCSATFCSLTPKCLTSYVPNLGLDLGKAIHTAETEIKPRKGAAHFADDPIRQVQNLDERFGSLGYIDRKYAYYLSVNSQTKDQDASAVTIAFSTTGPGPLVICEPPCFIDSCSKRRKMPMVQFVTLELDGKKLDRLNVPQAVEVGGPFCKVIAGSVEKGEHTLRISTNVRWPEHVMLSHVIPFSAS